MTPEQIIQQWRARREYLTRLRQSNYEAVVHLADAEVVADAYDAQARKLAEVEAENVKLRDWEDVRRQLERATSPCGHRAQYAFTEDGGKHISCLVCVKAERDALKAKVAQAVGVIAALPTMDDPDMMCSCISDAEAILKGDQ